MATTRLSSEEAASSATAPRGRAAYSEQQISNAQLLDIYAVLRALPAPTAVRDIPLLNQLKAPGK